jgi:hypothetical protein
MVFIAADGIVHAMSVMLGPAQTLLAVTAAAGCSLQWAGSTRVTAFNTAARTQHYVLNGKRRGNLPSVVIGRRFNFVPERRCASVRKLSTLTLQHHSVLIKTQMCFPNLNNWL